MMTESDRADRAYLDHIGNGGNTDPLQLWRAAWKAYAALAVDQVVPAVQRPAAAGEASDDARDAARYRWLRDKGEPMRGVPHVVVREPRQAAWAFGSSLDAAIDAAMNPPAPNTEGDKP